MEAIQLREQFCLFIVQIVMFGDLPPAQVKSLHREYHLLQMMNCGFEKDRSDSNEEIQLR